MTTDLIQGLGLSSALSHCATVGLVGLSGRNSCYTQYPEVASQTITWGALKDMYPEPAPPGKRQP